MPILNRLRLLYLLQLSQPQADRAILRTTHKKGIRRILELGMGTGERAMRMIELAQGAAGEEVVRYAGIDPFEGRPDGRRGLILKSTYQTLRATGAKVQLLPGDPLNVLSQFANTLGPIDLVVISAGIDPQSLGRLWFYVPRMLHSQSVVYLQEVGSDGSMTTRQVPVPEIHCLADRATLARRAA